MVRFIGKAAKAGGDRYLDPDKISDLAKAVDMGEFGPALLNGLVATEVSHLGGFLDDGRLRILFEAHRFDQYTGGQYRESHPNLSSRGWNRELYWGGEAEYVRLERAMSLDQEAAIKSASYGYPQMMGDEFWRLGYSTPADMISDFADSAHAQIDGMVAFLNSKKILKSLMDFDVATVSLRYNGPGYKKNRHHIKLAANIARFAGLDDACGLGRAGPKVVAFQAALRAHGANIVADGAFGPATGAALVAFQKEHRKPHPMPHPMEVTS